MSLFFQDNMDNTRVVKPLHKNGRDTICGIYFKEGGRLNYVGTAPIPTSLLEDSKTKPINSRIGFTVRD